MTTQIPVATACGAAIFSIAVTHVGLSLFGIPFPNFEQGFVGGTGAIACLIWLYRTKKREGLPSPDKAEASKL